MRAGATFCSAANTGFQGRGANLEMEAGWHVVKATLTPGNALFGCRVVFFVHDEFILECPIGRHTAAADELVKIMEEIGRKHLPDVRIGAKATCMMFWSKKAFSKRVNGELTIWNG